MNDKCIIIIIYTLNSKISPAKQTGLFLIKDETVDEKLTLHLRDKESKVQRRYFPEHGARKMGWVMSIFPVSVSEPMCCSFRLGCFRSESGTKAHPLIRTLLIALLVDAVSKAALSQQSLQRKLLYQMRPISLLCHFREIGVLRKLERVQASSDG